MTAAQQLSVAGIQGDSCARGSARQGSRGGGRSPGRGSIQTWSGKGVHLLVGDGHDGVLQLLQDFGDGLVGQERRQRREQQVDEDEEDGEEVLHAQFAESPGSGALLSGVTCQHRRKPVSRTCGRRRRRRRAGAEALRWVTVLRRAVVRLQLLRLVNDIIKEVRGVSVALVFVIFVDELLMNSE